MGSSPFFLFNQAYLLTGFLVFWKSGNSGKSIGLLKREIAYLSSFMVSPGLWVFGIAHTRRNYEGNTTEENKMENELRTVEKGTREIQRRLREIERELDEILSGFSNSAGVSSQNGGMNHA